MLSRHHTGLSKESIYQCVIPPPHRPLRRVNIPVVDTHTHPCPAPILIHIYTYVQVLTIVFIHVDMVKMKCTSSFQCDVVGEKGARAQTQQLIKADSICVPGVRPCVLLTKRWVQIAERDPKDTTAV